MEIPPAAPPKKRATLTTVSRAASTTQPAIDIDAMRRIASEILWQPSDNVPIDQDALPPKDIYDEALSHLLITLSPKVQRNSIIADSSSTAVVEPTLGLYCPLEGGDYVIDATIRAMARQIEADVVVIDAAQLAAGDAGQFGLESGLRPTASVVQLPRNPLHMPDPNAQQALSATTQQEAKEDENDESDLEDDSSSSSRQPFVFKAQLLPTTATISVPQRLFFDQFVKLDGTGVGLSNRPRIIYIRDFGLLAPYSSAWLPKLVESVVAHRRNTSGTRNGPQQITIVFGITPAISGAPPASLGGREGLQEMGAGANFLRHVRMNMQRMDDRRTGADALAGRPGADDGSSAEVDIWGEGTDANRARERRNKFRLRRWGEADFDLPAQLPQFSLTGRDEDSSGARSSARIGPGGVVLDSPMSLLSKLIGGESMGTPRRPADEQPSYFRASFLVPKVRSLEVEKESRTWRRRLINELLMRMGVGSIGGKLDSLPVADTATTPVKHSDQPTPVETTNNLQSSDTSPSSEAASDEVLATDSVATVDTAPLMDEPASTDTQSESDSAPPPNAPLLGVEMFKEWEHRIEAWTTVKEIADRAVGSVVSSQLKELRAKTKSTSSSDGILVPWEARGHRDTRKAWIRETAGASSTTDEENANAKVQRDGELDEVVERLKRDSSLNAHEQRLLGCIVNTATMPTTFSQVHLPAHTVDSVRTLVSLPLLYPAAFTSGVLKQHTMTGALLFGPPGTGKTLLVRALARESGARMMIVTSSDVMDMYVGEGEKLVRAVFSIARKLSPCVVFLDELDALFGARVSSRGTGSAMAYRGIITEFMQEMDGLKTREDSNVIVIGATNRPFDLDDAVLRRLPRRLLVDLPGEREREEILKIMLRGEVLESDVNLTALAKRTESFSGSDLKHLCVAAALDAVKETVKLPWSTTTDQKLIKAPPGVHEAAADASARNNPISLDSMTSSRPVGTSVGTTGDEAAPSNPDATPTESQPTAETIPERRLGVRHFTKALSEISPSASESLGSLAELRKWNEEFGENGRARRKMWGGNFGFVAETAVPAHAGVTGLPLSSPQLPLEPVAPKPTQKLPQPQLNAKARLISSERRQ
ncbi:AAA-domain-containing protein [Auriculariales sp. MPI-PUGE-AT-0066]|nr:AAA-domain-containing protein [Auriculariales sp. MPI-PUGE-AT-0066]